VCGQDELGCCFGDFVSATNKGECGSCPPVLNSAPIVNCLPCRGYFSFSRRLDLTVTFVGPVGAMQVLHLLIAVVVPLVRRGCVTGMRRAHAHTGGTHARTPTTPAHL
jgi:hypothetical protein